MTKRREPQQKEQLGREAKTSGALVIGPRVRELYEAKGWTQQELAWHANVSIPTISRVVTGASGVSASVFLRLVICLNTSADYLFGLTDDPRPRSR